MISANLRSKKGFPKQIIKGERTWHKVKNEKHRDQLMATNDYEFAQCSDDSMVFGFSFHLYYSEWVFQPTSKDLHVIEEIDQMLTYFLLKGGE